MSYSAKFICDGCNVSFGVELASDTSPDLPLAWMRAETVEEISSSQKGLCVYHFCPACKPPIHAVLRSRC